MRTKLSAQMNSVEEISNYCALELVATWIPLPLKSLLYG
jgi:hypothetical protein